MNHTSWLTPELHRLTEGIRATHYIDIKEGLCFVDSHFFAVYVVLFDFGLSMFTLLVLHNMKTADKTYPLKLISVWG